MKNPKECFCLRQNQTFFVLNELTLPTCDDGSEPLTFHHDTFSRFKFVIINADKKATTANIPVSAIPGIFENAKTHNFLQKINAAISSEPKSDSVSPAYTFVIPSGKLRGKTPAAALVENPEVNKQLLENQIVWLQQNINKYPKNATQIQVIEEALKLFESGNLNAKTNVKTQPTATILYQTGVRPLVRRKRDDGKCFVYEIVITWNDKAVKPIEFTIRNYYAPVVQMENGLLNVMAGSRVDEVKNIFSLTIDEWFWLEHILESQIRTFENMYAINMYNKANQAEKFNRAQACGVNMKGEMRNGY